MALSNLEEVETCSIVREVDHFGRNEACLHRVVIELGGEHSLGPARCGEHPVLVRR